MRAIVSLFVVLVCLTSTAHAVARVTVKMKLLKRYQITNVSGSINTNWRPTTKIVSGDVIKYLVYCENKGDIPATNVVVDTPIPESAVLIQDSAVAESAYPLFSIDGEVYGRSDEFRQKIQSAFETEIEVPINHSHFRYIKWVVDDIAPKDISLLEFQVSID